MFRADLSKDANLEPERFVGWLDNVHRFDQNDVDPYFFDRLKQFVDASCECADALGWGACGGVHTCELCNNFCGAGEIGVPDDGVLYVAPNMITHYVEKHRYSPPASFVDAVMRAPLPGTRQYAELVDRFRRWRPEESKAVDSNSI